MNGISRSLICSLRQELGLRTVTFCSECGHITERSAVLYSYSVCYIQEHVHMCEHAYGDQRPCQMCSSITRYLIFWDRISRWTHSWTGWAVSFGNPSVSALGLQIHASMPRFPSECLGIWAQVSTLAQLVLYCPSPFSSLLIAIFEGRRGNTDHTLLSSFALG